MERLSLYIWQPNAPAEHADTLAVALAASPMQAAALVVARYPALKGLVTTFAPQIYRAPVAFALACKLPSALAADTPPAEG
jgi:hypothetical protein